MIASSVYIQKISVVFLKLLSLNSSMLYAIDSVGYACVVKCSLVLEPVVLQEI